MLRCTLRCFALLALAAGLSACCAVGPASIQNDRPPNVVFILVDDMGWNDLSNEGSSYYESPNIDALAAGGMKFTRGYAASQVCSPSRASIMTGKYPTNHGITQYIGGPSGEDWRRFNRHTSHLPPDYARQLSFDEVTLAEAFKNAGYATFFAGKWHLGDKGSWPTDHGFDINIAGHRGGGPYGGGFFSPYNMPNIEDGPDGELLTLRLGRETADFIKANPDKPFFAFLSFYAVHAPIQTTRPLWQKYRDKADRMGLINAESRFLFDRRLPVRQVQDCPIYAGMVESTDEAVGMVLDALRAAGLEENTIVCFTSDNGGVTSGDDFATAVLPLRGGKGRQWEGGIREPFYIKAPGITRPGSTTDTLAHGIDWYPTLLDLANINIPAEQAVDGVSLKPALVGRPLPDRPLYWHYPHYGNQGGEPSSIIMRDHWKLIHYHEDGRDELYHLVDDPGEQNDLIEQHPVLARTLRSELDAWLEATSAKFPTPDPKFDPDKRAARMKRMAGPLMQRLERIHAAYLKPGYRPNEDWWGSAPATEKAVEQSP